MRGRLIEQRVHDETVMNRDLLPHFEFMERAHQQLLCHISDTKQQRKKIQSDY